MKTFTKTLTSFKELTLLSLVALMLLGASYANGQFQNPGGNPPSGNVDAPINTGSLEQTKEGDLTVEGSLDVENGLYANRYYTYANNPVLEFIDAQEVGQGVRIHGGSGNMNFQKNIGTLDEPDWTTILRMQRDGGLEIEDTFPYLLFSELQSGSDSSDPSDTRIVSSEGTLRLQHHEAADGAPGSTWQSSLSLFNPEGDGTEYATFANQVRAEEYCNADGSNCVEIGQIDDGQWCRASNDGERIVCTEDAPGKTDRLYNGSPSSTQTVDVAPGRSYRFFGRLRNCQLELRIGSNWRTIAEADDNESSTGNSYSDSGYYSIEVFLDNGNTGVTGSNNIQTASTIVADTYNSEWDGRFRTTSDCGTVTLYEI